MRVPELVHYVLRDGRLERADPVALSPPQFATFWLLSGGTQWTAEEARSTLTKWRQEHQAHWDSFSPTQHCTDHRDLWQIAANSIKPEKTVYFLMRWRPPYHFAMLAVSDHPWSDCTEPDPEADEPRSWFHGQ